MSNLAAVAALRAAGWEVEIIDTSPGRLDRGPVYYCRRLLQMSKGAAAALRLRLRRPALVYSGISGGSGLLIDALLLRMIARPTTTRVLLHHHNFTYIDADSRWMRILLRFGPKQPTHFLLCACMRDQYCERYKVSVSKTQVIDNLALRLASGDLREMPTAVAGREVPLRIGFLGTLSSEKGFDVFSRIAEAIANGPVGSLVEFECAGAVGDEDSEAILGDGDHLRYLGVLDREGVDHFLARQSLLLFPSRYPNEAQPNVIIEALHAGVPVLAIARGCVGELLQPHLELLVVGDEEFASTAIDLVSRMVLEGALLNELRQNALRQYQHLRELSEAQHEAWNNSIGRPSATA